MILQSSIAEPSRLGADTLQKHLSSNILASPWAAGLSWSFQSGLLGFS